MKKALIGIYGKLSPYLPMAARRLARGLAGKWAARGERAHAVESVCRFYRQLGLIEPGDLVFDVGANIGIYAEAFLHLGARVVAVEPQPDCMKSLQESIGSNPSLECECVGVGSKKGSLQMFISSSGTGVASTFSKKHKEEEERDNKTDYTGSLMVPVTTLDALIAKHGKPRYIKIDVEGFEQEVLEGLWQKVEFLSFEYHCASLQNAKQCMQMLEKRGFSLFNASSNRSQGLTFGSWVGPKELWAHLDAIEKSGGSGDIFASCRM